MFRSLATSVLALTIGAGSAFADVTPAEVWENLQSHLGDLGYDVTGQSAVSGSTLSVTNAVLSRNSDSQQTTITFPQISFEETGDAKVRVVIVGDVALNSTVVALPADKPAGPETPGDMATPDPANTTMTGTFKFPDNTVTVSGTPEDMRYDLDYPSVTFDLSVPHDPESAAVPVTGTLTSLKGTQRNVTGDAKQADWDFQLAEARLQAVTADTADGSSEGSDATDMQLALTGLAVAGTAKSPAGTLDANAQAGQAIAAGLMLDATLGFQTLSIGGKNEDDSTSFATGLSQFAVQLTERGIGYKGNTVETTVQRSSDLMPVPFSATVEQTSMEMLVPVTKAEAPQPFKLAYSLQGLTLADGVWSLFDPSAQLPRDPASLVVDLTGDVAVARDLFDPVMRDAETGAEGQPAAPPNPFTPRTLNVKAIALDAAGAKADITGKLEFGDNPAEPVGQLNGTFEGVSGLLDNLVAMGIVPQDQMTGVRMMLTMFTRPAEDNAELLTSQIEFREGGRIFANGQQVK